MKEAKATSAWSLVFKTTCIEGLEKHLPARLAICVFYHAEVFEGNRQKETNYATPQQKNDGPRQSSKLSSPLSTSGEARGLAETTHHQRQRLNVKHR